MDKGFFNFLSLLSRIGMYFGPLPKRYLPTYEGTSSAVDFIDKSSGGLEAVTLEHSLPSPSCFFTSFVTRDLLTSFDRLDSPGRLRLITVGYFNS